MSSRKRAQYDFIFAVLGWVLRIGAVPLLLWCFSVQDRLTAQAGEIHSIEKVSEFRFEALEDDVVYIRNAVDRINQKLGGP